MPSLRKHMARFRAAEFSTMFEADGLPFAPITQPEDLFNDPHLLAKGGLAEIVLPDSRITRAPLRPLTLNKQRPGLRLNSPQLGEHTAELLAGLGCGGQRFRSVPNSPDRTEEPNGLFDAELKGWKHFRLSSVSGGTPQSKNCVDIRSLRKKHKCKKRYFARH